MLKRRTDGLRSEGINVLSRLRLLGAQDPGDKEIVTHVEQAFEHKTEVRFIDNVLADVENSVDMIQARLDREERLARGGGLSQMIAGSLDIVERTSKSDAIVEKQSDEDDRDRIFKAERAAIAAVSAGNFERLEACVDDEKIDLNTRDEFGNTLLILAVQQGNKRMAKYLLRRGANMNLQNFSGNTVLHYAYAYNYEELGMYLESKGANTTLLNASNLTCYEGLTDNLVSQI